MQHISMRMKQDLTAHTAHAVAELNIFDMKEIILVKPARHIKTLTAHHQAGPANNRHFNRLIRQRFGLPMKGTEKRQLMQQSK